MVCITCYACHILLLAHPLKYPIVSNRLYHTVWVRIGWYIALSKKIWGLIISHFRKVHRWLSLLRLILIMHPSHLGLLASSRGLIVLFSKIKLTNKQLYQLFWNLAGSIKSYTPYTCDTIYKIIRNLKKLKNLYILFRCSEYKFML